MHTQPVNGSLPDWGVSGADIYLTGLFRELRRGSLVPLGDVNAFVARLEQLGANREIVNAMSHAAFRAVQTGPYSCRHSASRYLEVFENRHDEVRQCRFHRSRGRVTIPAHFWLTTRLRPQLRELVVPGERRSSNADADISQSPGRSE
jgi:hypothetical protein